MDRFVTVTPRVVDIVIGSNTRQTTIPRSTDKSTKSSKPRLKTKTTTTSPQPLFRPLVTELYEPSAKHINEKIQHILENVYHFKKFNPGQREIVTAALQNRDCFVLLPTGGGKSLCYEIPALVSHGVTIVISPLIALMQNQMEKLQQLHINARAYNSAISEAEKKLIESELLSSSPRLKILYCSPEMLSTQTFRSLLARAYAKRNIGFLVVDEAHCISTWGHTFRSSYRNVGECRTICPKTPIIALTATATMKVQEDIISSLHLQNPFIYRASFNRSNLYYEVRPKNLNSPLNDIISFVKAHKNETGIIYAAKRTDCEEIAQKLKDEHLSAEAYHAGMKNSLKSEVLTKWTTSEIKVVVATIAFGMGIDKNDVRFVLHATLPGSIEGYYQESGRAGRDGLPAICVVYYSNDDFECRRFLLCSEEGDKEKAEKRLEAVKQYCVEASCRRDFLLSYFGERNGKKLCNKKCDCCQYGAEKVRQKIISACISYNMRRSSQMPCINKNDFDDDGFYYDGEQLRYSKRKRNYSQCDPEFDSENRKKREIDDNVDYEALCRGKSVSDAIAAIFAVTNPSDKRQNAEKFSGFVKASNLKQREEKRENNSASSLSTSEIDDRYQGLKTKALLYLPQELKERGNVTQIKDMTYVGRQKAFEKLVSFLDVYEKRTSDRSEAITKEKASSLEYFAFTNSKTKSSYVGIVSKILNQLKEAIEENKPFSHQALEREQTTV